MHLATLGRFELFDGDPTSHGVRVMGSAKPLAMLAYLALAPRQRATRDTLVGLLWSDSEPERARSTLRQTMWSLRQRLGEGALTADGDEIVLSMALTVDCVVFEAAVADKDLERAWALYSGHFIADFGVMGGAAFEQWADLRRDRLSAAWLTVGGLLSRRYLEASRHRDALAIAKRLCDEAPERLEFWRTRLEALLADGAHMQATLDADALQALMQADGVRPDAETRALLDRIRRHREPDFAATTGPRRPDLVGREKAFASLIKSWKTSARGQGTVCVLRGAAGLGKTRLLNEFGARLHNQDAQTVMIRARPADRDVPYALVAALAELLAGLPGAAGVAPATASVLVELAPALSSAFPRAERARYEADEAIRLRTLALTELLQVVTEETAVALLIDDLHWADDASRKLLASLCERVAAMSVLIVVCFRPRRAGWPYPRTAVVLDLPPLSAEQLDLLVSSLAAGASDMVSAMGRLLLEVSAGIPLLAVAAIDLALDRGWLRIAHDRWEPLDLDTLRANLAHGGVLEQILLELPNAGLSVLLALALARQPLSSDLLAATLEHANGAADIDALITVLEQRAVVISTGTSWDVAHDTLADAALEIASDALQREVARGLARALLREPNPPVRVLQLAGRLLTRAKDADADAASCFQRWMLISHQRHYWRDPISAAGAFLGDDASVHDAQRLAKSLSAMARLVNGYPALAAAVAMMTIAVVGSLLAIAAQPLLEPRATHMTIETPPTSRGFLWDTAVLRRVVPDSMVRNAVPLHVSFRDANDVPSRNTPRSVQVHLSHAPSGMRLEGDTIRAVAKGEADLRDLVVRGGGAFQLEVSARTLPSARTQTMYVAPSTKPIGRVTIVSGTVNGQTVDSSHRHVEVSPGAVMSGQLHIRTLTELYSASLLLGAVAAWGDRTTNWISLSALPPHGESVADVPLVDATDGRVLHAPTTPGRYRLVFLSDAETEMRFIASRTNWLLIAPRWNDGDDIADVPEMQFDRLDRDGYIPWSKRVQDGNGKTKAIAVPIIGTTLEIVVVPRR